MATVEASVGVRWAQHLRLVRDTVLESLSDGSITLAEVLERRLDPAIGEIRLLSVLESLPGARKIDVRRKLTNLDLAGSGAISGVAVDDLQLVVDEFGATPDSEGTPSWRDQSGDRDQ